MGLGCGRWARGTRRIAGVIAHSPPDGPVTHTVG